MHLGEERSQWVFATDAVTLLLDEVEPLAIVDLTFDTPVRLEHLHGDLLETLAAQAG